MTIDRGDRISLSWQQFIWTVSILVAVIVTWQNLSYRLGSVESIVKGQYTKADIDIMKRDSDMIHNDLYRRIEALEKRSSR